MVFSSLPVNQFDSQDWQRQGNQHQLDCVTTDQNSNFGLPQLSSPVPASQAGSSQARVNSMVERARIAKVPFPEAALNCPRCDSTNTKFCYFNNYSLTQPRHFCKTCRRYWTRGGALRNVPVGGGFRRNKRSKSNGGRSKSTVAVSADNNTTTTTSSLSSHPSYSNPSKLLSYGQIPGFTSNLPTLSPLQSLGDYNSSNIGIDFGGIQISNAISGMSTSSGGILDQWRISSSLQQAQQLPFLVNTTGLEHSSNMLYPLIEGNQGVNQADPPQQESDYSNQLRSKPLMDMASSGDGPTQARNVKAEENGRDLDRDGGGADNLSRNFLGNININSAGNGEFTSWGGNSSINNSSWTGFTSNNSTGHLSF